MTDLVKPKRWDDKKAYNQLERFLNAQGTIDKRTADYIAKQPQNQHQNLWKFYHALRAQRYGLRYSHDR
jgi:hypothetical protein